MGMPCYSFAGADVEVEDNFLFNYGRVTSVDSMGAFIIINRGAINGIEMGDILEIYRDDKFVGKVEVIQVRQKISACDIKQEDLPIRVGDVVKPLRSKDKGL